MTNMADECPICTMKMIIPTAVNACGHKFCFLCIKGVALQNSGEALCPMCRGPVDLKQFKRVVDPTLEINMRDPEDCTAPPAKKVKVKKGIKEEPVDPDDAEQLPQTSGDLVKVKQEPLDLADEVQQPQAVAANQPDSAAKEEATFWVYKARGHGWWRYDPRTEKDINAARHLGKQLCEVATCGMTFVIDFQEMIQYRKDQPNITREIARVEGERSLAGMQIRGLAGVSLQ